MMKALVLVVVLCLAVVSAYPYFNDYRSGHSGSYYPHNRYDYNDYDDYYSGSYGYNRYPYRYNNFNSYNMYPYSSNYGYRSYQSRY